MQPSALQSSINGLDQPSLDKAVFEEIFGNAGEPKAFSTSHDLADIVIADLYAKGLITSASVSIDNGSGGHAGLLYNCAMARPVSGAAADGSAKFEMFGRSFPRAICRAALLVVRSKS
jgi:hypothetical protein